jgi:hypothetical protein
MLGQIIFQVLKPKTSKGFKIFEAFLFQINNVELKLDVVMNASSFVFFFKNFS